MCNVWRREEGAKEAGERSSRWWGEGHPAAISLEAGRVTARPEAALAEASVDSQRPLPAADRQPAPLRLEASLLEPALVARPPLALR